MATISLPSSSDKNRKQISAIGRFLVGQGVARRNRERVEWLLNYLYLQGEREFGNLDYENGRVMGARRDNRGHILYRYEQATRRLQDEKGRRLTLDARPMIDREGDYSLDSLQKSANAQAALSAITTNLDIQSLLSELVTMTLIYGTAGLATWTQKSARLGRTQPVAEVVPPWELLPVPGDPVSEAETLGLIRHRCVSLEWIKTVLDLNSSQLEKIETKRRQIGTFKSDLTDEDYNQNSGSAPPSYESTNDSQNAGVRGEDLEQEYTDLDEFWFYSEDKRILKRYMVMAGGWVCRDTDFSDSTDKPIIPIHLAKDIDIGCFYGKSTFSLMRPTNMEAEACLRQLWENVQDLDLFGILLIPNSFGVDVRQLKASGKPRFINYEIDLTAPQQYPRSIQPANMGDWPGKVAGLAREIIDDMAGLSEVMKGDAPGRVDSAAAIGRLMEASNLPLNAPLQSLAKAFSGCYMAMLGQARQQWKDGHLAQITMLDDSIAGVQINERGQLQISGSAIPYPTELKVTIRSEKPISETQRKIELADMLKIGVIDPLQFRLIAYREGLDLPVGNRAEWENWRKATLYNLIMFGDGRTPGGQDLRVSEEADLPNIQLMCLQQFMAKPEFALASTEVRKRFIQRKQFLQDMLGNLPQGMGNPEDEALVQQQLQQQMQQDQGGAGMSGLGPIDAMMQ